MDGNSDLDPIGYARGTTTEDRPTRCAACGTENRPTSRFCDNCGSALESACPSCGDTANRPDARFCATCGTSLGAPRAPAPEPAQTSTPQGAERRLVSVLFTDLVGFTTLAEDRDPEAVRELLSRYFDAATRVIGIHGGTVEKFIGDAVMAVWGTPVAHEDDAERAVRAALELLDAVAALHPDLQARAGVLTGDAAVTLGATNQGMVAGDLVNTAARLQGVAEAGTVLVGEATVRAAERAIVFEPLGEHSLKGKTSPVPAWRAVRVVANRGGQGRTDALEPPFVGRDEELRQLKDVLHAVGREARPRLVSITGPGGIGKSRLVWELEKYIDGVTEDIWWHRGRSPSYGEGITFWALGEMVRRRAHLSEDADEATTRAAIAATLAEHVADEADRERIEPALLSLLGFDDAPAGGRDTLFPAWRLFFERIAERGTTVLVFEDLQWADSGLLDFIDHVLEWSRGLPIMVVTLARPELFDRRPDWGAGRRHLTALALEPLSDEAVRQLLEGLVPGLPADALAAVVGRAEGVPLYAVETVRGLLADGRIERRGDRYAVVGDLAELRVPDSLRSLIASRLDALDGSDRGLLQDASVLGQAFSAEALAAIGGGSAEELAPRLRDLVRRELLDVEVDPRSPERGQYRFVQSLIREVAYGTLARRDRRARHLAVARHYEAAGDDELAGALAGHYLAAHEASDEGPEADAIAAQARIALTGAATRAAALGAHEQALRYLEHALAITTEPVDRAALFDRAAISATARATIDAQRYAEAAVEAYRAVGDRSAEISASIRLARALIDVSNITAAIELLTQIVPQAESMGDEPALAAALANLARAYMRNNDAQEGIAAADRALAIAELHNLEAVVAEAFVNKGACLAHLGRRREATALHAAGLEMAQRLDDRAFEMRARNNYASVLSDDDPARAGQLMREAAQLARDIGDRAMHNWMLGNAAASAYAEGVGWDETIAALREAEESASLDADHHRILTFLVLLCAARGDDTADFMAKLRELIPPDAHPEALFQHYMSESAAAMADGDAAAAYRWAVDTLDLDMQNPEVPAQQALHMAIATGDPELIRFAASAVIGLPAAGRWTQALRAAAHGALAAVEGRHLDASRSFLEGYAVMRELGQNYDAAELMVSGTTLLPSVPEIRAVAEDVRGFLEGLGARPSLRRLEAALANGSVPPSTVAADHSSTPTPSPTP